MYDGLFLRRRRKVSSYKQRHLLLPLRKHVGLLLPRQQATLLAEQNHFVFVMTWGVHFDTSRASQSCSYILLGPRGRLYTMIAAMILFMMLLSRGGIRKPLAYRHVL
jgi:hypothetical protein